jgi:hypothetical protein
VSVDRFVENTTVGNFGMVTVLLLVGTGWTDLVAILVKHCVVVCVEIPKAAAWQLNSQMANGGKCMVFK